MTWEYGNEYGTAERDELIERAEMAWEISMAELAEFGCIEFEPQFDWDGKCERGDSRAMRDIIEFEGAADAESLFELF